LQYFVSKSKKKRRYQI